MRLHVYKNKINIIIGLIMLLNVLLLIKYRVTFGTGTFMLLSILFITIVLLYRVYIKNRSKKTKAVLISFIMVLAIWIISFIYIESNILGAIVYTADSNDYDYLIILGAGLKEEKISFVLEQRLDKGIEIFKDNLDAKIIVSGGQGPGESLSEAQAMKNYLLEHEIPEESIILEDTSTSTAENFMYSKDILEKIGEADAKLLVITNDYHLYRALMLAEKNGLIVDGVSSETPIMVRINYLIREYYAVIKNCFLWK
jgi:uncharacterized SAM-binding protein YcdF (DUF218 family)